MSSTVKFEKAEPSARARRMEICQSCPYAVGGKTKKYLCSRCGCVLAAKTMLPGARCPEGKW